MLCHSGSQNLPVTDGQYFNYVLRVKSIDYYNKKLVIIYSY